MSDNQFLPSFEGTWARLSQVAVMGAQYNSRERQPHAKCLEGTRIDLLKYIHELLDDPEKNQLIWLHGMAGVGKSAVAFSVAEKMRGLKVTEQTNVEKRLAGTFFFSRKHTKRCTTGYFFATLVYQLANNFPSIRKDVNRVIRHNPALLDPDTPLCDQMEALFLQPLRWLRSRLRECAPLAFVIDALDECTSEPELVDLIISLAQALHDPDLPVTHILLTSRSESHISKVFQNDAVRSLVCEIPVKTSGEGIGTIISLDGADVDNDIYIFLRHSFREMGNRHPDFPQPSRDQLAQLASRAGRRFIVASTMVKFIIDDEYKDPRDRLQLMLKLTSELLAGTDVYKLYDCILSTCADPKRAYLHLSIVAALADPLPLSQISKLLGPGQGYDSESTLIQLRSVMDIPTDNTLPVNIYHSSVRDYVSDPSNCSLPYAHNTSPVHSLLADTSLRLMIKEIPESTALLDELSALKKQSQVMQAEDPHRLKDSLSFLVQPPESLSVLIGMLWLRGDHRSDVRSFLDTVDGWAWLQTQNGRDWLQTQGGRDWLQTQGGRDWLQTQGGRDWLQTPGGRDWLQIHAGRDWLQTWSGWEWLQIQTRRYWLQTQAGQEWLQTQTQAGRDWLQTQGERDFLQTQAGRYSLQTQPEVEVDSLQAQPEAGQDSLQIHTGCNWLQAQGGRCWLQTKGTPEWLQTQRGGDWLQTGLGRKWLGTQGGKDWIQTKGGRDWLGTQGGKDWLQTLSAQDWLQTTRGRDWVQTRGGQDWLQTRGGQDWFQTQGELDWLQTQRGLDWLKTPDGRGWLRTPGGRDWLQASDGQAWQSTPAASVWVTMEEFSSTLEAISEYIIVPDSLPLLPTFQVVQQFKSLPDFLMFPVFLALMPQNHFTSALPEVPDREIIRAMNAFTTFANEARERSQSASDAFKYACQNWVVHLSRAPNPWDDTLNRIFQAFWNRHLLSWLEQQWCLKGLRSCLDISSKGQKLAKFEPVKPDEGLSAIGPDIPHSTTDAPHARTTGMMSGSSIPATTLPTEELIVTLHAEPVPTDTCPMKPISRHPPTSPLAPSLPPVPSAGPDTAVFYVGTSRKRKLDEFQINSNSPLESDTPHPSKCRK